jgi:hypothetical protein
MTLEEAVRRIDQTVEEKLTELDLSGLGYFAILIEFTLCKT